MHDPPRILIVDDNEANRDIVKTRLAINGYEFLLAEDGEQALDLARREQPDLILLDVMMPKIDGIGVCRELKADPALPFIPIILLTARSYSRDIVAGLEAGADEYLTKPVDQIALAARVKSMLRLKDLHDRVTAHARDLADWNRALEQRVAHQLRELERVGQLKRFLAPQVAEMIVSTGNEKILESHRREITVVVCDLRGFTAFSDTAEPEDVMAVLREYQTTLGRLIDKYEGTLERFTGDGLLVWFNDPLPCADPCVRAARMAIDMRDAIVPMTMKWRTLDHDLGFAIGIAHGYATLGRIGFERRSDYAAVGMVVNLAARLCAEATDRQILVDSKVFAAVGALASAEAVGELQLKGFSRPIKAYNLTGAR